LNTFSGKCIITASVKAKHESCQDKVKKLCINVGLFLHLLKPFEI